ncbi:uncharacterized protein LOC116030735 [Ipomoea triloba]|uniref:uncharacterized protein LOC116030735 n=1 Tax=Ipomoea triloba TaxID=35885 RepID=UPI00125DEBFA|nr:uncharacterized protein LOC116030735 [Ipomoea triloba]
MAEMTPRFNHFSHRHPLQLSRSTFKPDKHKEEEEEAICCGCEFHIAGAGYASKYTCTKPSCGFVLHDSCFDLPRKIRHDAHPKHALTLLPSPPYSDREFTCDACGNSGHAFIFHCSRCKFDLHVECASVPETEVREDHPHPLALCYSNLKGKEIGEEEGEEEFECFVCKRVVLKWGCWFYYCFTCKCGTHMECATN